MSVFDGDTSARPPPWSVGSIAAETPELYGPTTATTDLSATIVAAAAVPLAASDESSSTLTLIVQPGMAFLLFACATASSVESRMPWPKLVSPRVDGRDHADGDGRLRRGRRTHTTTTERDERARGEECRRTQG